MVVLHNSSEESEDEFLRPLDAAAPDGSRGSTKVHVLDPNAYDPRFAPVAYRMSLLGAELKDIAAAFQTSPETVKAWREAHPAFDFAFSRGGQQADAFVAQALYRRATGYTHFETKFATSDGMFTDERTVAKHVPPDVKAAIFWLKNRAQTKWRDEQAPLSGGIPTPYADTSDQQLRELIRKAGLTAAPSPLSGMELVKKRDEAVGDFGPPPKPQFRADLPAVPRVPIIIEEDDDGE